MTAVMTAIFTLAILLNAGFCFAAFPGVVDDLVNIFYNLPVAFENCKNVRVLLSNITYVLYTSEHRNGIVLTNENLNATNPQSRYIFIIHGWLQTAHQLWVIQMKNKYLDKGPANIITVDWSNFTGINYGRAFCAVPQVGMLLADLIQNLRVVFGTIEVHMIGFSIGAHLAGYAGQKTYDEFGYKIKRITGLDAAAPGYAGRPANERLDIKDAEFVQALHTNNGRFGYKDRYGTVDFQINCAFPAICGALQPCCPANPGVPTTNDLSQILPIFFCSHVRSVTYFIASIDSFDFLGVPCKCTDFALGLCKRNPTTVMGENCPATAKDELFLNPNGIPPYPKGLSGTGGIGRCRYLWWILKYIFYF